MPERLNRVIRGTGPAGLGAGGEASGIRAAEGVLRQDAGGAR